MQRQAIENADLDSFQSLWNDQLLQNTAQLSDMLLKAMQYKSNNIAQFILSKAKGMQITNKVGRDGYNALCMAVVYGDFDMVKLLLQSGAESNATQASGVTALHIATLFKHFKIAQVLLKHHAMADALDANGQTPLMYASLAGDIRITSMLLKSGAKIDLTNNDGMTALMMTAKNGNMEVCKLLLQSGAQVHPKSKLGFDARQFAADNQHSAIVETISYYRHNDLNSKDYAIPVSFRLWYMFSFVMTLFVPGFVLKLFGIEGQQAQQAWREKIMFCQLVLLISCIFAFLTFGIQRLVCTHLVPITLDQVQNEFSKSESREKFVVIRGMLYDVGDFTKFRSHPPGGEKAQPAVIAYIGRDASGLFPLDQSSCTQIPIKSGCQGKSCHQPNTWRALEKLNSYRRVAYTWDTIQNSQRYVLHKDLIYDVGTYLDDQDYFLGSRLTDVLRQNLGRDASKDLVSYGVKNYELSCMKENLLVGQIDGQPLGCFTSQIAIGLMIILFVLVMVVKFIGAMIYSTRMAWKIALTQAEKDKLSAYVLILVPCYSENEHQIKRTFDSIIESNYTDTQKLVVAVADGVIVGQGNQYATGDIVLRLMVLDDSIVQGETSSYHSVSHDRVSLNRAKLYSGTIKTEKARKVPIILVYKIGNVDEEHIPKSGNRGKRDSQLILMSLLSRTLLNERMAPLEYHMFQHIKRSSGVYVDKFEHVLMIDADTVIDKEAMAAMVKCMDAFPNVMALCGETRVANKFESWVTMIQVFEYYVAHYLGKSFESMFGAVTCLPGCASFFRIKATTADGAIVPILANPDIVESYSDCNTTSLHKKNLLLLGEDRYLTTLLLKQFPRRDTCFLPQAYAHTTVPTSLSILLSQRRRWVNSTIFNLWQLMFVNKLCGIFCFSMQFIVFLDLLGTILSPVSVAILIYIGVDIGTQGLTQTAILPLAFICLVVGLQCLLVFFPLKNSVNLFWMLLFLIATPIWQGLIPLYSFWNIDNFSWGKTRAIQDNQAGQTSHLQVAHSSEELRGNDPDKIPLKRWHEWHKSSPITTSIA